MRHSRGLGAVVVCALVAIPAASQAQSADKSIDVQMFDYSIGPKSFFSVDNGQIAKEQTLSLDFLVTYLTTPFVVYNSSGPNNTSITNTRDEVIQNATIGQLTGAYGVTDKIQIGANLPFVFRMNGQGIDTSSGTGMSNGLGVTGLGDMLVEGKFKIYDQDHMRFAAIGGLTLPTGFGSDGSQFIGDKYPTVRLRGAFDWTHQQITLGATLGFLLRDPQDFYGTTIGQQMTFGGAIAFAATDRFSAVGELYGRMGLQSFSQNNSPIEAIGGVRVGVAPAVAVVLGGGGGLDHAIGAPELRAFASVSYVPGMYKNIGHVENPCDEATPDGMTSTACKNRFDRDGDGIPDKDDKCPDQAEDHDGFEDDDGCPDLDNDKDGIPDLQDRCPNDPEDGKEPYPKDGCPATKRDSDGDGIPDAYDACPLEEEDFDNFEDGDGCPDLDNDKDGVPDAADKCPVCPEDKDGFEDSDGCPDLDNDHDGIPDSQDKCPNEPETINGVKDDDGCPDTGGATLVHLDGDRLTVDKVPDLAGGKLSKNGTMIAEQIALVMRGQSVGLSFGKPAVTKWLIAVSMKKKEDAQKVGDAIKEYLAKRGVTGVDILAAAGANKVGGVVQERSDADQPFVCPAGMEVKQDPSKVTPKGTMPGAGKSADAPAATPAPAKPAATPAKPDDKKKDLAEPEMDN